MRRLPRSHVKTSRAAGSARALILSGIVVAAAVAAPARALEFAPKLHVLTSGGLIKNLQNDKTTPIVGGFFVSGQIQILSWAAAGLGYKADFDLTNGVLPLKGFDVFGKFSLLGLGSQHRDGYEGIFERGRRDRLHLYVKGNFATREYYLSMDGISDFEEGSIGAVDVGVGLDFSLSRHVELNLEFLQGLLSFSSKPESIRLRTSLLSMGLGYVF